MKVDIITPAVFLVVIAVLAPLSIWAVVEDNNAMRRHAQEREFQATRAGKDAFTVGLTARENPYDKGSGLHALWLSGYRQAMEAK